MKLIRIFMTITVLFCLNSCLATDIMRFVLNSYRVDPEKIVKEIEQYPGVNEVVFVAVEHDDFKDYVGVGLVLRNGGEITVFDLDHDLGGSYTTIREIGSYQVQYIYYDEKNKGHDKSSVNIEELELKIRHRLRSLKSIIKHYDALLAVIERDYVKTSQSE
ncbi:hypothetical protein FACS189491_06840 [Spirochaetia bacterium]|nr:hypothetical protein FACS189491_06840 [Spirochaetia bacterium]